MKDFILRRERKLFDLCKGKIFHYRNFFSFLFLSLRPFRTIYRFISIGFHTIPEIFKTILNLLPSFCWWQTLSRFEAFSQVHPSFPRLLNYIHHSYDNLYNPITIAFCINKIMHQQSYGSVPSHSSENLSPIPQIYAKHYRNQIQAEEKQYR